jgi:glycosyltransferase involved in cell wall biosynthesis
VDFNQFRPVDGEQRRQLRSALQIPEDGIALGYVATFNPKKAQLNFLERAVPLLREKLPQVKFYFIGDFDPAHDSYARSCQQAVERLGLEDCVRFVGFTAQVACWYQALDLTVVASRREGLARCMIESLACGTPVISFEVCSAREILVEHQCGGVFPQGDYGDLVDAIVQFGQTPPLREQWRLAGIQTARLLFQPQAVVEQYEALYLSSMASKPIMHYAN